MVAIPDPERKVNLDKVKLDTRIIKKFDIT